MSEDNDRLILLEAAVAELRRDQERVEKDFKDDRMSVNASVNAQGEAIVRLDTILRGADGRNGLCSRVTLLDQRLQMSDEKFDDDIGKLRASVMGELAIVRRWLHGIAASLVIVILAAAIRMLLAP